MSRKVATERSASWVYVMLGVLALAVIVGFGAASAATGATNSVHLSEMLLPDIEPFGRTAPTAV